MSESQDIIHLINKAREEARRDSIKSFLLKNKAFAVAAILLALMLLIVLALSTNNSLSRKEEYSEKFSQILNQEIGSKNYEIELQNLIKDDATPEGIRSLAAMRLAGNFLEKNKTDEAYKIYKEVSENEGYDEYTKDLASLLMTQILVKNAKTDDKNIATQIEEIENKAKIFKFHIMEQRAILEFQNNNFSKAAQIFETIAKAPESSLEVRERARKMAIVASEKNKS